MVMFGRRPFRQDGHEPPKGPPDVVLGGAHETCMGYGPWGLLAARTANHKVTSSALMDPLLFLVTGLAHFRQSKDHQGPGDPLALTIFFRILAQAATWIGRAAEGHYITKETRGTSSAWLVASGFAAMASNQPPFRSGLHTQATDGSLAGVLGVNLISSHLQDCTRLPPPGWRLTG
ncbi:hypothetical protein C8034_v008915 [Colletotrichum sidae]|uniref:Uncharacterized protein n=1 Tax=Colletotrichum sidae TaxID=1347389 RepID=A0A4R8TQ50_9PEZI|nr:hypothetical protein C8034_v008915 [Colletotrichum sidae]